MKEVRMRRILKSAALALAALSLLASPAHAGESAAVGTLLGGALGGLFGSQFGHGSGQVAYTGLGVFTGAVVGNSIGSSMDHIDTASGGGYAYAPAYYNSYAMAPAYEPTYVAPPAPVPVTRVVYVTQPVVEVRAGEPVYVDGGYLGAEAPNCREYTQQIRIGGEVQTSYGTACQQPDGTWQIQR